MPHHSRHIVMRDRIADQLRQLSAHNLAVEAGNLARIELLLSNVLRGRLEVRMNEDM
jgi:hypothetical protein